ncbi:MAG: DUF2703 domain-containing protein [Gammaproteobacteria bacterium]
MIQPPTIHIRFLYCSDCLSHAQALTRLRQALASEGLQADIEILEVQNETQARKLNFLGSPTILINGRDIAPGLDGPVHALTCRAYLQENGRISPLPSLATMERALRDALSSSLSSTMEKPHDCS